MDPPRISSGVAEHRAVKVFESASNSAGGVATQPVLLQMAGRPGAGKTTLARAIGTATGAAVLDLDVLKSAMLGAGTAWEDAGALVYVLLFALADDLLGQGRSVIIDSPSRWPNIPREGARIADQRGGRYVFIECVLPDRAELLARLKSRTLLPSQHTVLGQLLPASADENEHARWEEEATRVVGPAEGWLTVDTGRPVEVCLGEMLPVLQGT
jgi:predicted kinase